MDNKELHELIKLFNRSHLSELKLETSDFKLLLRSNQYVGQPSQLPSPVSNIPAAMPVFVQQAEAAAPPSVPNEKEGIQTEAVAKSDTSKLMTVNSPMIGTFYRSPSPDKDVFVKIGDRVEKGTVLCIIEAMKLFNEIESEVSGRIVKVIAEDATPVEYDQPLFLIDPA